MVKVSCYMDRPSFWSRSLEPLNSAAMWSSEVEEIVLVKGEKGLGFSILDYQVKTIKRPFSASFSFVSSVQCTLKTVGSK